MRGTRIGLLAIILTLAGSGCASRTMYDWGAYEESLYLRWIEPDSYDPAENLRVLSEQVLQAETEGRLVPPGVRAHLAFLLLEAGDRRAATEMLLSEKRAFPESAALVDGMAGRLR